jgi:ABC-type nitrate/sulfonate/bicarbonate transport system substrate-binding protein
MANLFHRIVASILVALACLFMMSVGHAAEKIKVGMINVTSYNGWIAKDQGFFDKEGLDVELVRFASGAQVNQALLAGSLDFGYTGFGPAIFAAAQHLPFLMIANGAYSDAENPANAIIVRRDSPYKTIKDLDGKRIAVQSRGTIEHLVAEIAAANAGISVKIVELPFEYQEKALSRGDVDAVSAHTPNVEWMELKGHRVLERIPGGSIPYFQIANLTVRRDYAEKNPDVVVRMVKAFIRTNRWIMDHQAEAKAIVVQKKYLGFPEELAPHVMSLKWQRNGMPMLPSLYYFANQMKKIGSIQTVPHLEDYFVTNYIQKALADIGTVPDPDFDNAMKQSFPK